MRIEGDNIVFDGAVLVAKPGDSWALANPSFGTLAMPIPTGAIDNIHPEKGGDAVADSPFKIREEVEHPFKAVKITRENLREIAGHVLQSLGGTVEVDETVEKPFFEVGYQRFTVGLWLVEEWDYTMGEPLFRVANAKERKLHDLR